MPDAALELLHGIKNPLHEVKPDDVVSGPGNLKMQFGIQIFQRLFVFEVQIHPAQNLFHPGNIFRRGALCRIIGS